MTRWCDSSRLSPFSHPGYAMVRPRSSTRYAVATHLPAPNKARRWGTDAGYGVQRGFTLLELLMALSIFALVSAMAYGGLRSVMDAAAATREQAERLASLQLAFGLLTKDLEQAAPRPIRDAYGDIRAAMDSGPTSDFALELTRSGGFNPAGLTRSALRRVAYDLRDGTLSRFSWPVLDRGDDRAGLEQALVDGVESLALRFLHPAQGWRDTWPPTAEQPSTVNDVLPRAVELRMVMPGTGEIRRVIRVSG